MARETSLWALLSCYGVRTVEVALSSDSFSVTRWWTLGEVRDGVVLLEPSR